MNWWQLVKYHNDYIEYNRILTEMSSGEEIITYYSLMYDLDYDEAYRVEDPCTIQVGYYAECVRCERQTKIECETDDFDPDQHYCGGSPRCCP